MLIQMELPILLLLWLKLYLLQQPLVAIIFYICLLAEAGRAPFDLAEAEQELIGGWHTEYSSMKWALFFMGEYIHLVVGSAFFVTLFLGGWQVPFLTEVGFQFPWGGELLVANWAYVLLGVMSFTLKVLFFCWLFMQIRWTLPRFRYDQLMKLGWKGLFPVAVLNVIVTAVVLMFLGDA